MKRVVIAVVVLAAVLSGIVYFKVRAQREALEGPPTGSGTVELDAVDVSARMAARIAEVHVEEGQAIEAGAHIVTLDCREPRAMLAEAQARLAATEAQARAAVEQAEAAGSQSQAARASIGAARANAAALNAQQQVASREAERVTSMGEHAAVSQRDQVQSAAAGLAERARAAHAAVNASTRTASAARRQAQAAAANAEAAAAAARAVEAAVARAEVAVSECTIISPRAGVVERLHFDVGELLMPGSTVARIADPSDVRITFYIPNAQLGEVSVGATAEVVADAYPSRTFEASVHRVALEAEFTPRNVQTRSDRDRLVYPVELRLENEESLLRAGMPVTVTLDEGGS